MLQMVVVTYVKKNAYKNIYIIAVLAQVTHWGGPWVWTEGQSTTKWLF